MARYSELYSNSANNAEIAIGGSELFGVTKTDTERKQKHGSYNALLVSNNSSTGDVKVSLDGLSNKIFIVATRTTLSIIPDEGIFFDSVLIENLDAAAVITAADLYIRYAVSQFIGP